ncbi:hypothetical protein EHS25_003187 [Saitozyma podzolica]|uniref:Uncharacterized protein n=1 Tax=Saitozyma podzolica TaxID=1890683 RepID=A0A427Y860_9TREE|nr:hypothetical protein EHS25_003187 [Saitozyma podzolica]
MAESTLSPLPSSPPDPTADAYGITVKAPDWSHVRAVEHREATLDQLRQLSILPYGADGLVRSRFMLCGSSNRPLMSHRPGNFAYAIHNGDTGELLAFKVASCVDCLSRSFPCDMDHGKWVNGKAREPVFYLPGKGEDVEPEWFPIPKAKIPPDVHDEDALQVSGRTVEAWANRSQHVETDVDSSAERKDKARKKGKKRKATTVSGSAENSSTPPRTATVIVESVLAQRTPTTQSSPLSSISTPAISGAERVDRSPTAPATNASSVSSTVHLGIGSASGAQVGHAASALMPNRSSHSAPPDSHLEATMPTQQVVGSSSTSSRSPSAIRPDTGTQTSLSVVKNDLERSLRIIGRLEEQAVTDATSKSLHDERLSDLEKQLEESRREANDAKRELEDSKHEIEDAKKVARTSREDLAVAKLSEAEHRRTAEQWQRRHEELTEDFRNKIMELERLKQAHVEVTEQLEKATGKIARFQSLAAED